MRSIGIDCKKGYQYPETTSWLIKVREWLIHKSKPLNNFSVLIQVRSMAITPI